MSTSISLGPFLLPISLIPIVLVWYNYTRVDPGAVKGRGTMLHKQAKL